MPDRLLLVDPARAVGVSNAAPPPCAGYHLAAEVITANTAEPAGAISTITAAADKVTAIAGPSSNGAPVGAADHNAHHTLSTILAKPAAAAEADSTTPPVPATDSGSRALASTAANTADAPATEAPIAPTTTAVAAADAKPMAAPDADANKQADADPSAVKTPTGAISTTSTNANAVTPPPSDPHAATAASVPSAPPTAELPPVPSPPPTAELPATDLPAAAPPAEQQVAETPLTDTPAASSAAPTAAAGPPQEPPAAGPAAGPTATAGAVPESAAADADADADADAAPLIERLVVAPVVAEEQATFMALDDTHAKADVASSNGTSRQVGLGVSWAGRTLD